MPSKMQLRSFWGGFQTGILVLDFLVGGWGIFLNLWREKISELIVGQMIPGFGCRSDILRRNRTDCGYFKYLRWYLR